MSAVPALSSSLADAAVPQSFWWLRGDLPGGARFAEAWTMASGKGVTVRVVDNGVNAGHADLGGAVLPGMAEGSSLPAGGSLSDDPQASHGTQVAGLIAGKAGNGIGSDGAAPGARIGVGVMNLSSSLDPLQMAALLKPCAGVDVSNNSWGRPQALSDSFLTSANAPVAEALRLAARDGRDGLGTVTVFAAGNARLDVDGRNIGGDSNLHNLTNNRFAIAVGASDADGKAAFFSSPGANVLLSAPGFALTTAHGLTDGATDAAVVSGTSFAAPLVSSAAALMLEVNPALGYRDVREILALTARMNPDDAGAVGNAARMVNGGGLRHDRDLGFGVLDAAAAVRLARFWDRQSTAANEVRLTASFGPSMAPAVDHHVTSVTLADVPAGFRIGHVDLRLTLSDSDLRDLRVDLISPSGTRSVLAEQFLAAGTRTYLDFMLGTVVPLGEGAAGTWRLEFSHATPSAPWYLFRADLAVYGDAAPTAQYFTDGFAALAAQEPSRARIGGEAGGTLNFAAACGGVDLDLGRGTGMLDGVALTLTVPVGPVIGSGGNDRLTGGAGADTLSGGEGADRIIGGAGADLLQAHGAAGGRGQGDTLMGGTGNDVYRPGLAGGGTATISEAGGGGSDRIVLERLSLDRLAWVRSGDDLILRDPAEGGVLVLSGHFDPRPTHRIEMIEADDGLRFLKTGGLGTATADVLVGGSGSDVLRGMDGADILVGGPGKDLLYGGRGRDVFVFADVSDSTVSAGGRDTIYDFRKGEDRIQLSGIDTDPTMPGDQAFRFSGTVHDGPGSLRAFVMGGNTVIGGDINGDGHDDFRILVSGMPGLDASDFIL